MKPETIRKELEDLASSGNEHAAMMRGLMAQFGWGCTKDHTNAEAWYAYASARGNAYATYLLARLSAKADGLEKAHKRFLESAEQGLGIAATMVATNYSLGAGVRKDVEKARKWFRRAGDLGDNNALFHLAMTYADEEGHFENSSVARGLLQEAFESGVPEAEYYLAVMDIEGDCPESAKQGLKSLIRLGHQGCYLALSYLSRVLDSGNDHIEKNAKQAAFYKEKAYAAFPNWLRKLSEV